MPRIPTDLTRKKKGDWRWAFLEALAQSACVSEACIAVRVSRDLAYDHRRRFPKFRAKWDEALIVATELLEAHVRRRAFKDDDPSSATLAIFLLKANKPEKYRDNYQSGIGSDIDVTTLSDEELQAIIEGKSIS